MDKKHAKKKDGGGLYIAICCCILVIALIGYANNVSEKNKEEEKLLTELAGENTTAPEAESEVQLPVLTEQYDENEEILSEPSATEPVLKNEVTEELPEFVAPVGGKVLAEFSDKQIFYEKIEEWRTHNGVDMTAEIGESVSCSMDGKVSKVFMGSLGYSVQIDHENGLSTIYSNLDDKPTVSIGDSVKKGDVIGHIGNSALADMIDAPHLHFEVMENGKYKNPVDFLNR